MQRSDGNRLLYKYFVHAHCSLSGSSWNYISSLKCARKMDIQRCKGGSNGGDSIENVV